METPAEKMARESEHAANGTPTVVDTQSAPSAPRVLRDEDFPSLGPQIAPKKPALRPWGPNAGNGAANGTHKAAARSSGTDLVETVRLASADIHVHTPAWLRRGENEKNAKTRDAQGRLFSNAKSEEPRTVGDVIALLRQKYPSLKLEASSSKAFTTFVLRSSNAEALANAKRELLARLEKERIHQMAVPSSVLPFIIGHGGKGILKIAAESGADIKVPPQSTRVREALEEKEAEDEDAVEKITLSGSEAAVHKAQKLIEQLVHQRQARKVQSIKCPKDILPFICGPNGQFLDELVSEIAGDSVTAISPSFNTSYAGIECRDGRAVINTVASTIEEPEIVVSGDASALDNVVQAIKARIDTVRTGITSIDLNVSSAEKSAIASFAPRVLEETGCVIGLSKPDSITLSGHPSQIVHGLSTVMKIRSDTPSKAVDLSESLGGGVDAHHLARHVLDKNKWKNIARDNDVKIFLPLLERPQGVSESSPSEVHIVGKDPAQVEQAQNQLADFLQPFKTGEQHLSSFDLDPILHKSLQTRKAASRISHLEGLHDSDITLPEGASFSNVIVVGPKKDAVSSIESELADLSNRKRAESFVSQQLPIPTNRHELIRGNNGTMLNALLPEHILANIDFAPDQVTVRGDKDEVSRLVPLVQSISENISPKPISLSFPLDPAHVPRVVGKHGNNIQSFREHLGVRVDISDDAGDASRLLTIRGLKEPANEAKRRILALVDQLSNENEYSVPLPQDLELWRVFGSENVLRKRLEAAYDVLITVRTDPSSKSRTINVRGPNTSVQKARKEIVDLVNYEKERSNVLTFQVPSKFVSHIVGRGGSRINLIMSQTDTSINVNRGHPGSPAASISVRGSKNSIIGARAIIEEIVAEADHTKKTLRLDTFSPKARLFLESRRWEHPPYLAGFINDGTLRFLQRKRIALLQGSEARVNEATSAITRAAAEFDTYAVVLVVLANVSKAALLGPGGHNISTMESETKSLILLEGNANWNRVGYVTHVVDHVPTPNDIALKVVGPPASVDAAVSKLFDFQASHARKSTISLEKSRSIDIPGYAASRLLYDPVLWTKLNRHNVQVDRPFVHRTDLSSISDVAQAPEDTSRLAFAVQPLPPTHKSVQWHIRGPTDSSIESALKDLEARMLPLSSASHVASITVPNEDIVPGLFSSASSDYSPYLDANGAHFHYLPRPPVPSAASPFSSISTQPSPHYVLFGSENSINAAINDLSSKLESL